MEYGPVDVVIVAIGEPRFDGRILNELEKAASTGAIRVLDAMVLARDEGDGEVYGIDLEDMPADMKAGLGFIETGTRGLFDSSDAAALSESLAPGSAIVALAIEHAWARQLTDALYDAGAEIAVSFRVAPEVIDTQLAALSRARGGRASDFSAELRSLASLKAEGILTDEEFAAAKARLIGG